MKILRGSETYIYENCDPAWALMQEAGEEPATIFSEKGTKIHRVLAAKGELTSSDLDAQESKIFEDLFAGFRRQVAAWRADEEIERSWIETEYVWRLGEDLEYRGHPDRVLKCKDRLFIPDFKTGYHPQDAISATNAQLRAYVAIVDANIEEDIREITVWIDKPGRKDPPAYYDREAIQQAKIGLRNMAMRITGDGPKEFKRGPWCQYCSGKVICPLWREEIHSIAATSEPDIDNLPDHELARIAPKLAIAKKVIERLQARLEERVKAEPEFFADWHFKPGKLVPHIKSVGRAWFACEDKIDAETFLNLTKLQIGKLVEIFRLPGTTWEEARAQVEKRLGDNLEYKRSKPELVYEPQKRAIDSWDLIQQHSQTRS